MQAVQILQVQILDLPVEVVVEQELQHLVLLVMQVLQDLGRAEDQVELVHQLLQFLEQHLNLFIQCLVQEQDILLVVVAVVFKTMVAVG